MQMLILMVIFFVIVSAIFVSYLKREQMREEFITRRRQVWASTGKPIHAAPQPASYLGNNPLPDPIIKPRFGALAIIADHFLFESFQRGGKFEIPLAWVRWISLRTVRVGSGKYSQDVDALVVHWENDNGWQYDAWMLDDVSHFARLLADCSGHEVYRYSKQRDDYGPAPAVRMSQDIYGVWSNDIRNLLYLAPDRLIFDKNDQVLLQQMRAVRVIEIKGDDLLQIEYADSSGKLQMVAYAVDHAARWADQLQQRTSADVEYLGGRKKKAKE